jgi:uncharacterized protein YndB with AHSA1/START domain
MRTVRVERTIAAPVGDVFEMLTDHAGYTRFRGVKGAERFREGEPDPNGVGAMRRIKIPPVWFEEEILVFERPSRMDYVIRKANFPLEHESGSIEIDGDDTRAHVVWTSTLSVPTRFASGALTAVGAFAVKTGFERMLADVDKQLTG